jgi:hypothetical protein
MNQLIDVWPLARIGDQDRLDEALELIVKSGVVWDHIFAVDYS